MFRCLALLTLCVAAAAREAPSSPKNMPPLIERAKRLASTLLRVPVRAVDPAKPDELQRGHLQEFREILHEK